MSLLSSLNQRQREAVTHYEGPLLVVAGAGSGKTRVITTRVAHLILEHGVSPGSILAVTFTNKAADEMRERVERQLEAHGLAGARPPTVSTFHSFCVRLLRQYGEPLAEIRPGFTTRFGICDSADQISLVKSVMRSLDVAPGTIKARDCISAISAVKCGRREADSEIRVKETVMPLAPVFDQYQADLLAMNGLDFDDLLLEAVRLLRHSQDAREAVRARYEHLLVDEYQDTNRPQYDLLRLMARPRNNVCVVGDEDQSIYSWRGADISNILGFRSDFPGARTVRLEQHYRSTGTILKASSAVISRNANRHEKTLWTKRPEGDPIQVCAARGAQDEARFVAERVKRTLEEHGNTRVGIFYRTNAQSRQFEEALQVEGVDFLVLGSLTFYQRREIRDILAYLRVAVCPEDGVSLRRIINVPARGIGKATMGRVESHAKTAGLSLWRAIDDLVRRDLVPRRARSALRRFRDLVSDLQGLISGESAESLVAWVAKNSGYVEMLRSRPKDEAGGRLENLAELEVAARESDGRGDSLQSFLDRAALLAAADRDPGDARALLMTLHGAKGLEFPTVFVTGVEDGLIPHRWNNDDAAGDQIEEERRLFYVGMTRARDRLTLTWAHQRQRFGEPWQLQRPSPFLEEIPPALVRRVSAGTDRFDFGHRPPKSAPKPPVTSLGRPLASHNTVSEVRAFFDNAATSPAPTREAATGAQRPLPVAKPRRPKLGQGLRRVVLEGKFARGSRVRHRKFGIGVVERRDGRGPHAKLSVYFRRHGLKRLLARAANLEEL